MTTEQYLRRKEVMRTLIDNLNELAGASSWKTCEEIVEQIEELIYLNIEQALTLKEK